MLAGAQIQSVKANDETAQRLIRAEQEIEALKAKFGTQIEPPKAEEPPIVKSEEPVNHSRALYLIQSFKQSLAR